MISIVTRKGLMILLLNSAFFVMIIYYDDFEDIERPWSECYLISLIFINRHSNLRSFCFYPSLVLTHTSLSMQNPPASLLTAMGRSKTSSLIARPAFQRGQPRKLALHFAPNPPTLLTGATSDCGLYSSHNSSSSNLHGSMSNLNSSCQAAASGSNGAVQNSGRFAYYHPPTQLSLNQLAIWIWTAFGSKFFFGGFILWVMLLWAYLK